MRKKTKTPAIDDVATLRQRRKLIAGINDCLEEGDTVAAFLGLMSLLELEDPSDSVGKRLSVLQAAAFKKERLNMAQMKRMAK